MLQVTGLVLTDQSALFQQKKLMAHSGPLFLYIRLFKTIDRKQMLNVNIANDWIRNTDRWY